MSRQIDAVILWVDASDQEWQRQRMEHWDKYCKLHNLKCRHTNAENRFTSCGELRYCLRGLYTFAPWLRKIYLVTNGQKPNWLKKHSKIKLITHDQIMDAKHLPTFNSSAIEMNLHRIPGLSPAFIYLNDDFFLTRAVTQNHFFNSNGQAYYYTYSKLQVPEADYYNSFNWIIHSDRTVLDRLFGEKIRQRPFHQAFVVFKQAFEYLERNANQIMQETSQHQFRPDSNLGQLSINIYAVEAIGLELGLYTSRPVDRKDYPLHQYLTPVTLRTQSSNLLSSPPIFLCINDLSTREDAQVLEHVMSKLLPHPAPCEADRRSPPAPKNSDVYLRLRSYTNIHAVIPRSSFVKKRPPVTKIKYIPAI